MEGTFRDLVESMRNAIRDIVDNVDTLTDAQVMTLFVPTPAPVDEVAHYGDARCICGHPIKYIWELTCKLNKAITINPVGSECIKRFTSCSCNSYALISPLLSHFKLSDIWSNKFPICEFSAKNGFDNEVMTYLTLNVLDQKQIKFLSSILHKRKGYMTDRQKSFMYGIFKTMHNHYNTQYNKYLH